MHMKFLKNQFSLIIIVFVIALTTSLPHIYGFLAYGKFYSPLGVEENLQFVRDETFAYAAEVQQVLRGQWGGDSYLWEYKNMPNPYLGEIGTILPIAAISKAIGSVPLGFFLSDLIFPSILFLIINYFLIKNGFKKVFALSASLAIIITPFLSSVLPFFYKSGTSLTGSSDQPLFITRTPHPQVSLIYLFLALFLTSEVLKKQTKKILYLWLIILGFSLYASPFVASSIVLGTLIISPLILNKLNTRTIILSAFIILLLSLPYLFNTFQLQSTFNNNDFLLRVTSPMKLLFPNQLRYVFFAIILFIIRRDNISKVILAYVIAASIISDGHQLILKRSMDADHWISRVMAPISTLTIFLILEKAVHFKNKIIVKCFWVTLASVILLTGLFKQLVWIKSHKEDLKPDYALQNLIKEVKTQTGKDDVINSFSIDINQYLTGLTARRIYYGPMERVLSSSTEQLRRLCDLHRLSINNRQEDIDQLLYYEADLENTRLNKIINKTQFKKQCNSEKSNFPQYKLNFLIFKDQSSGEYKLIKVGI
ncbi:MAG: hypothetical protein UR98_C0032G0003 [Parcubacteria group bacterium GW2011_GWA1_36_12]|nr:MAG: hypothetical protein UR98_C0032G0003 [Parcubacteria group bacterium GW2011_GWA1_36_12]